MVDGDEEQHAIAVCENCGTAHAARIGPDGEIRPISTGQGNDCTCGESDFQVFSDDEKLMADRNTKRQQQTE